MGQVKCHRAESARNGSRQEAAAASGKLWQVPTLPRLSWVWVVHRRWRADSSKPAQPPGTPWPTGGPSTTAARAESRRGQQGQGSIPLSPAFRGCPTVFSFVTLILTAGKKNNPLFPDQERTVIGPASGCLAQLGRESCKSQAGPGNSADQPRASPFLSRPSSLWSPEHLLLGKTHSDSRPCRPTRRLPSQLGDLYSRLETKQEQQIQ